MSVRFLILMLLLPLSACVHTAGNGGEATSSSSSFRKLDVEVMRPGDGDKIIYGQIAVVHYTGWLVSGEKFDSSLDRGKPFSFQLGLGQVIQGWERGIEGMRIGEKRRLTIPARLAYGKKGMPPLVPGNAPLIFEVELLEIH